MIRAVTRREFLKLQAAAMGMTVLKWLPREARLATFGLGRVTFDNIRIRQEPSFTAEQIGTLKKDQIINLLEVLTSSEGPEYNPTWYRTVYGYVHSGYIQKVAYITQIPKLQIPETGQLGEVTVPYTTTMRIFKNFGWQKLYRIYYQSVHWITGIIENQEGKLWYQITDDRLHQNYYVRATHIRFIEEQEISPIHPEINPDDKKITISLESQTVSCYESNEIVFQTKVATGVGGPSTNNIPRDTPKGKFRISWKMPVRHMGNGNLTDDINSYELPGVPWCSFFVSTGVAFHGAYWHDNYGRPMSSGCVNMRPEDAKWLYRWSSPSVEYSKWYKEGPGTIVVVE